MADHTIVPAWARRWRLLLVVPTTVVLMAGTIIFWYQGDGYPRLRGVEPDGSWVVFHWHHIPSSIAYQGEEWEWLVALRDDGHVAVSPRCYALDAAESVRQTTEYEVKARRWDQWGREYEPARFAGIVMSGDRLRYLDVTRPEADAVAGLVHEVATWGTDTRPCHIPAEAAAGCLREWRRYVGYPELARHDIGLRARAILKEIADGDWVTDTGFGRPQPPYSSAATWLKLTWCIAGVTGGHGTADPRFPVAAGALLERLRKELLSRAPEGEPDA